MKYPSGIRRPPSGLCTALFQRSVTLLSVSNVGLSFGATELFKNITFTVADGERWGIIGRNGAGKSSIFKIITGEYEPNFTLDVARKDLRLMLETAGDAPTPMLTALAARMDEEIANGQGSEDFAVIGKAGSGAAV